MSTSKYRFVKRCMSCGIGPRHAWTLCGDCWRLSCLNWIAAAAAFVLWRMVTT